MKIAVVGAGAIGAYVGAALHRGGADVSLIARGKHLEAMRHNGVTVLSARGDFHAHPNATDDPTEIGPVDIVFLGLKAYSYVVAGPLIAPLLAPHTGVVAAQNGIPWWYFHGLHGPYEGQRVEAVDPGGAVSAVIPPAHAIGCVVYCSTEIQSPGVIRHIEGTRYSIGEPDGTVSERCTAFSQAMIAGGLKCPVETNLRSDIWLKLMGNVAFNPISVLTGATMGQIATHPGTRDLVLAMMHETAEIASRLGSSPKISVERRFEGAAKVGDHKTSMLIDYKAGKLLETDALLKAPVELGRLVGAPTPSLQTVHALIDLLTRLSSDDTTRRNRGGLSCSTLRRALLRAQLREVNVAARLGVDPKTVRCRLNGHVPLPRIPGHRRPVWVFRFRSAEGAVPGRTAPSTRAQPASVKAGTAAGVCVA